MLLLLYNLGNLNKESSSTGYFAGLWSRRSRIFQLESVFKTAGVGVGFFKTAGVGLSKLHESEQLLQLPTPVFIK